MLYALAFLPAAWLIWMIGREFGRQHRDDEEI